MYSVIFFLHATYFSAYNPQWKNFSCTVFRRYMMHFLYLLCVCNCCWCQVLPTECEVNKLYIELRSRALLLATSWRPAFTEVSLCSSEGHMYLSDIGRATNRSMSSVGITWEIAFFSVRKRSIWMTGFLVYIYINKFKVNFMLYNYYTIWFKPSGALPGMS